jgi:T5SS/PEP-CTERM-associated repeat protein/autotransporter-associated beta strand protein
MISTLAAVALAFIFSGVSPAQAQTVWLGATSGNYSTASNWNPASVPIATTNVTIDTTTVPGNWPVITVTNAHTKNIVIGDDSSSSSATLLTISGNGTLASNGNATIGNQTGSTGAVTIDGANALWSVVDALLIGNMGNGSLTLANGGTVDGFTAVDGAGNGLYVGYGSGSTGAVSVSNSTLELDGGGLVIGESGNGSLTATSGGNINITAVNNSGYGLTLGDQSGAHGNVTVSDSGTKAYVAGAFIVGNVSNGNLSIQNGGNVSILGQDAANTSLYIGAGSGSTGVVTVNGTNSVLNLVQPIALGANINGANGKIVIGAAGNGNLTISNGGTVNVDGRDDNTKVAILLGYQSGSHGVLLVTDSGSTLNVGSGGFGALYIGNSGNGNLTIANGGNVSIWGANSTGVSLWIANGGATIQDTASSLHTAGKVVVTNGTFTISDGNVSQSDTLQVADSTHSATVHQSGGNYTIGGNAPVVIGIGSGVTGNYIMDGGNLTITSGANGLFIGSNASAATTGNFSQTGGNVTVNGNTIIGTNANNNGTYTISGGNYTQGAGQLTVGQAGNGTLIVNGGIFNGGSSAVLDDSPVHGNGSIDLNGGTLQTVQIVGNGYGNLTFNGGTLQATADSGNFISNITNGNLSIQSNGAYLDSNGHNITVVSNFTGTGDLNSVGTGNLALSGNNNFTGNINVTNGVLALAGNNGAVVGNVNVNSGTLAINNATALASGNVTIGDPNTGLGGNIDNTSGASITVSTGNSYYLNSDLNFVGTNDLNLGTGTVNMNGNVGSDVSFDVNFNVMAGNLTIGGPVVDNSAVLNLGGALGLNLNKLGSGTLILGNTTGTSYGGGTNVEQGSLVIANGGAIPNGTVVALGDGNGNSGTLVLGKSSTSNLIQTVGGISVLDGSGSQNAIVGSNASSNALLKVSLGDSTTDTYSGYLGAGASNTGVSAANALSLEVLAANSILTLTGDSTYFGGTKLDAGTLQISSATNLGQDTGTSATGILLGNGTASAVVLEVTNGGLDTNAFSTDRWITLNSSNATSAIQVDDGVTFTLGANSALLNGGSSSYALNKTGNGTLVLAGTTANYTYSNATYTAATNVQAGTLQLGNDSLVPHYSNVTVSSGATFDLNGYHDSISTLSGAGNVVIESAYLATGSGNVATTFSGIVSGAGNLSKFGTASFTLAGENTFSGNMNINYGTLNLTDGLALQNATVNQNASLTFTGITSALFGALAGSSDFALANTTTGAVALTVGNNDTSASYSGNLSGAGNFTKIGDDATQTLSGNITYLGNTTVNNGTLVFAGNTTSYSGNIIVNADVVFDQSSSYNYNGAISGTGNVTQNGSATLTLLGNSNYTGNTTLVNGTLVLDGVLGDGNGTISATNELIVGQLNGNNAYLSIVNGGNLTGNFGDIGANTSAQGFVTLDHSMMSLGYLYVGDSGNGNLTIQNGGTLSVTSTDEGGNSLIVGNGENAKGNVTVTGATSSLTIANGAGLLIIGGEGFGKLNVNGGAVVNANGTVSDDTAGGNLAAVVGYDHFGEINVSDHGAGYSTLNVNNGAMVVGYDTYGKLQITNGGVANLNGANDYGIALGIGLTEDAGGKVLVRDAGSSLNLNGGAMVVGVSGNGKLVIANGGTVNSILSDSSSVAAYIGYGADETEGKVIVAGVALTGGNYVSSTWTISNGGLALGASQSGNATGNLGIYNGGIVSASGSADGIAVDVGNQTGSDGNIKIAGAYYTNDLNSDIINSTLNVTGGYMVVGDSGNGNLTVANAGFLYSHASDTAGISTYIGQSGIGNVTITDTGSQWFIDSGAVKVGHGAEGDLSVYNGGNVDITSNDTAGVSLYIGTNTPDCVLSTVTISGSNCEATSSLSTAGTIIVGENANGELLIENSGCVTVGGADSANVSVYVGWDNGSNGNLTVDNAELDLNNGSLVVGQHGNGTLNVFDSGSVYLYGVDSKGFGLMIGRHSDSTGTVYVDDGSGYLDVDSGATVVGYRGVGNLTVTSDASMTSNASLNGISAYIGYHGSAAGSNATVSDGGEWNIYHGALAVGYYADANLTVSSGGDVYTGGTTSANFGAIIGYHGNSNSNVTVTDAQSELQVDEGSLVVGLWGTGNLTVQNGGLVDVTHHDNNFESFYLGYHSPATGSALITDSGSELRVENSAAIVGRSGYGNLTVANGGYANLTGSDPASVGLYVGQNANGTGDVTITDAYGVTINCVPVVTPSNLTVANGAVVLGYNGLGNLTVANGGYANLSGQDSGNIGLYLGYNSTTSVGNLTVTDVNDYAHWCQNTYTQSKLDVTNGATIVGYNGTGNLLIANGGYANLSGNDESGICGDGVALYIGYSNTSTGNVTVDGYESNSEDPSTLYVGSGAVMVGYNGTGGLSFTNGGYGNLDGTDGHGVALYVGYNSNGNGTVSVDGNSTNAPSELDVNGGATIVGYHGNGTLSVTNGGTFYQYNNDNREIGLYLGRHSDGSGSLLIDNGGYVEVDDGATAIGYRGTGTLSITNGGELHTEDSNNNGLGVVIGWHGSAPSANATVSDYNMSTGNSSTLLVGSGSLVVGNWGYGNLTVTNGGYVNSTDYDSDSFGLVIGRGANGVGNLTVQDYFLYVDLCCSNNNLLQRSTTTIGGGALVVGGEGTGTMNIVNGGLVNANSNGDHHSFGAVIGYSSGSTGNVTVSDAIYVDPSIENNSISGNFQSQFNITGGALVVGYNGNATLTVQNGGYVDASGDDSNDHGVNANGAYIGYNTDGLCTTASMIVTDVEPVSGIRSEFDVEDGALVVGYNGTGTLSILNGGLVDVSGYDNSKIGLHLGSQDSSSGTITVSGVVFNNNNPTIQPATPFNYTRAELSVDDGSAIIGGNGYGNLSISNGGLAEFSGNDSGRIGLYVGKGGDGSGDVFVDGGATINIPLVATPDGNFGPWVASELDVTSGAGIIGFDESGNLSITNGGVAYFSGNDCHTVGLYLGYDCGITGNLLVSDFASNIEPSIVPNTPQGSSSSLYVQDGATVIGYHGTGNLTVANGGYVDLSGTDSSNISLYLGRKSDGSGYLTVTDRGSNMIVNGGATVIGYRGQGNLTVANGGYLDTEGLNNSNISAIIGYHGSSTGIALVDNAEWDVNNGALVVGYWGPGNLTVQNGGYLSTTGADNYGVGVYLGYHGPSTGTMIITDAGENWDNTNGSVVVGRSGTGNLTITNGATAYLTGYDSSNTALSLGDHHSGNGYVTVTDSAVLNVSGYTNEFSDSGNGLIIIGNSGTGTMTVANGGVVNQYGYDGNNTALLLGAQTCSTGILTVDGSTSSFNVLGNSWATVVGASGNGNLTIINGGVFYTEGWDNNSVGMYLGSNHGGIGNVSVDGTGGSSTLTIYNGTLIVGDSGTGNLTVTNGGLVKVNNQNGTDGPASDNADAVVLGNSTGGNGSITVDGQGSWLDIEAVLQQQQNQIVPLETGLSSGLLVVGESGNGNLTITNHGLVTVPGGLLLADQSGSTGNVSVTDRGVLEVGSSLASGDGSYSFLLDGATLRALSNFCTSINITLAACFGYSVVDTNGYDVTDWGNITGSGTLKKKGDGTLTLYGVNDYTGDTIVSDGTLTLDGTDGGNLTGGGNLIVGDYHHNDGTFIAQNGATLDINDLIIGNYHHSHGNVTIDNSSATVEDVITVGNYGHGSLTVQNFGFVNVTDYNGGGNSLIVGANDHGRGYVTITGNDTLGNVSELSLTGAAAVGQSGHGSLIISNGATFEVDNSDDNYAALDIGVNSGSRGHVTLTDANSTLSVSGLIVVGDYGTGTLTIANGASLLGGTNFVIGLNSGSNGTVTVTDNNTVMNFNTLTTQVGGAGNGTLSIANGATVNSNYSDGSAAAYIGYASYGNGTVSVDGSGSMWNVNGTLIDGYNGNGTLTITNGGNVSVNGSLTVGAGLGPNQGNVTNSSVIVDGHHSKLSVDGTTYLGLDGNGTLTITNGGRVTLGNNSNSALYMGGTGAGEVGNLSIGGWRSKLDVAGPLYGYNGTMNITGGRVNLESYIYAGYGNGEPAGTFNIVQSGGKLEISNSSAQLYIGVFTDGKGTYTLSDGKFINNGTIYVGLDGATGTFTQSGGKFFQNNNQSFYVGLNDSTGTVNINGGFFDLKSGSLYMTNDANSTATVNLNGGTLATAQVVNGGESYGSLATLNFNGGVLKATGDSSDFLSNFDDGEAVVKLGGAFINSSHYDITINTDLAGVGALTKLGSGNLTLTGTNTYRGGTNVLDGTLIMDGSNFGEIVHSVANVTVDSTSCGTATFIIQNGGTVISQNGYIANSSCSTGTVTVTDGGSLWHNSGEVFVGVYGNGTLNVLNGAEVIDGNGDIAEYSGSNSNATVDGEGSLWKNSATLTVGDQGNGSLSITNGGSVTQTLGDATIGLGSSANGSVLVTDVTQDDTASSWVIAGNLTIGQYGIGDLTVTNGGFVRANAVTVAMNCTSTGSLELVNGGELSLNVLSAGLGSASFTFNGGILQGRQNNSDFITGFTDVTLGSQGGTIDTQHFAITVNALIDGAGNLTKAGNGNLTLSNANTFTGDTMITGGNLILTNDLALQNSTLDYLLGGGKIFFGTSGSPLSDATLGGLSGDRDLDLSNAANGFLALSVGNNGNDTLYSGNLTDIHHLGSTFAKIGSGTLTLTGDSTFGGGTTVYGGFINFNADAALGRGNVTLQNGGLQWATGTSTDISSRLFLNTGIDTLDTNGNDVVFATGLTGTGTLVKTGQGNLSLSGCNTYSGDTYINEGKLIIDGSNNNASLTGSGNIYVGDSPADPTLSVLSGGYVSTCLLQIGVNGAGKVYVNGSESELDAQTIDVGAGACANMTVLCGGYVSTHYAHVGLDSSGTVKVTGSDSELDATKTVYLAQNGNDGTLEVQNNATADLHRVVVGDTGSGTGSLNITCNATVSIGCGGLTLAKSFCSTGDVLIDSNGTLAINGNGGISAGCGTYSFAIGNGTVQVFCADLSTSIDMSLNCGGTAVFDTNSLNATLSGVLSGGGVLSKISAGTLTLTNEETYTGGTNVLGGTLVVDGGSIYHPNADLYVGGGTSSANFTATNSATITADELVIANNSNDNDIVTIDNSTVNINDLNVGNVGTATMTIQNGGDVEVSSDPVIGNQTGSNGTLTITDAGSVLNVYSTALIVGNLGNGTLNIANGGVANLTGTDGDGVVAYIGYGAQGTALVTDSGSKLKLGYGPLVVGEDAVGNLTIANGAHVYSHSTDTAFILGDASDGTGNLLIDGTGSHWNAYSGTMIVGNNGMGNLTIQNGGELKSYGADESNISIYVANGSGSNGTVYVSGGSLKLRDGSMIVGDSGNGTLTVDNSGYVSISSGNVLELAASGGSNGTLNLNDGGTISLGGADALTAGSGTYAVNFNGGTLRVHGSDFSTSLNITLGDSTTSTVNTNGYNATLNGNLSGTGGLNKGGAGTLTLNADNTYTGATNVTTGNLVVNGNSTSSVNVINAGSVLGGQGTIGGNVAITNGGAISPGIANTVTGNVASGLTTLTVTGDVAWNVTATTVGWHLGSANNAADLLAVTGNVVNTGTLATIIFDFQGTGFFDGVAADSTYTLITSSNDMSNAGFSLNQFSATNVAANVYDATNQSYFIFANGGTALEFVVVPEPTTWGLIAGGVMLGLAGLRRKRGAAAKA